MSTNEKDAHGCDVKDRRLHLIYRWTVRQGRRDLLPFWIDLNDPTYLVAAT